MRAPKSEPVRYIRNPISDNAPAARCHLSASSVCTWSALHCVSCSLPLDPHSSARSMVEITMETFTSCVATVLRRLHPGQNSALRSGVHPGQNSDQHRSASAPTSTGHRALHVGPMATAYWRGVSRCRRSVVASIAELLAARTSGTSTENTRMKAHFNTTLPTRDTPMKRWILQTARRMKE